MAGLNALCTGMSIPTRTRICTCMGCLHVPVRARHHPHSPPEALTGSLSCLCVKRAQRDVASK